MKRIAWFTPQQTALTGLPSQSVELLTRLRASFTIDHFAETGLSSQDAHPRVWCAHDFVWKHHREPYDLTVYELADSPGYGFVWPYLVRHPGIVILHDNDLHSSRAQLLRTARDDDYRAEFHYNHPDANPDIPELGIAGLLGTASSLWPMLKVVVESSRLLIVDNPWLAEALLEDASHDRIAVVEGGVDEVVLHEHEGAEVRARHDIPNDAVVFASFGEVSPHRRTRQILESLSALSETDVYFLACGSPVAGFDLSAEAKTLGIDGRVKSAGTVRKRDFPSFAASADVCVCLRWPERGAAFVDWLRCLATGRPTIVTDFSDRVDVPSLDPRDWQMRLAYSHGLDRPTVSDEPSCVSVDIVDEAHSLRLAMTRLARDRALRRDIGSGGKRFWERRFTLDRVVKDFGRMIHRALDTAPESVNRAHLPEHLRADGTERLRSLLGPFGELPPEFARLAPTADPEVRS